MVADIVLKEPLATLWKNRNPFQEAAKLQGEVVRHKEGRETIRCEIKGKIYYRKMHNGVGWGEIFKNFIQLRLPVVDASNEWNAIGKLHEIGVSTLTAIGYGCARGNPATRQSFLITKELRGTKSTAVFTESWPEKPPAYALRIAMIEKIAWIARQIHEHGINHRDLYLCHFLVDISAGNHNLKPENINFYLVDLHRAQMRKKVPKRWLVKDIASIYFSALDIGLTKKDVLRFLKIYFNCSLRTLFKENKIFFIKVEKKARKLYCRDFKREPVFPLHALK